MLLEEVTHLGTTEKCLPTSPLSEGPAPGAHLQPSHDPGAHHLPNRHSGTYPSSSGLNSHLPSLLWSLLYLPTSLLLEAIIAPSSVFPPK